MIMPASMVWWRRWWRRRQVEYRGYITCSSAKLTYSSWITPALKEAAYVMTAVFVSSHAADAGPSPPRIKKTTGLALLNYYQEKINK